MASKRLLSLAIFLALNLLFFNPIDGGGNSDDNIDGSKGGCPRDTLKLGVCANVLSELIDVTVGTPPTELCCTLIQGLTDLEVAVCLCTVVKANVLGLNISLPIDLSLLINYCGRGVPSGFQCS